MSTGKYLNFNEAQEYAMNISDQTTRELTLLFLSQIVFNDLRNGAPPDADFDVMFFCKLIEKGAMRHSALRTVLSGQSLAWPWPDTES